MKTRRKFDKEFKHMVVELSKGHANLKELASELGIRPELIYRWRKEATDDPQNCFPGNGNFVQNDNDKEKEIARLKKQLRDAQLERDILKKAVNIFSKSDGNYTGL